MARYTLSYGPICGVIIVLGIIATIEFDVPYQWLGYMIMLIAFTAIFVAVRRFRDQEQGGVLSFGKGFKIGLGITLAATLLYVLGWESYLLLTDYSFAGDFVQASIEAQRSAGVSEAELTALISDMEDFESLYANFWLRISLTATEILPVGLLVSLVCAALLKTSNKD